MYNNPPIYLVRGAPGSGKTTFANLLKRDFDELLENGKRVCGMTAIFETDNFFKDQVNGRYLFDADLLETAHNWNIAEVVRFCRDYPECPCIVANTFSRIREMHPYENIARIFNRDVRYFRMMNTCYHNVHDVPATVVYKIQKRFEDFCPDNLVSDENDIDLAKEVANQLKFQMSVGRNG